MTEGIYVRTRTGKKVHRTLENCARTLCGVYAAVKVTPTEKTDFCEACGQWWSQEEEK